MVAEAVMLSMGRDPTDERPFDRHRTGDGEPDLEGSAGSEALMGEQSVIADSDAVAGHDVQSHRNDDLGEPEKTAPHQGYRDRKDDRWSDDDRRRQNDVSD
jgi:hypothetical protein